jgi:hypothetical protein
VARKRCASGRCTRGTRSSSWANGGTLASPYASGACFVRRRRATSRASPPLFGGRWPGRRRGHRIRVHTRVEHRVFYIAKFEEAVYVIHAFEKRTRQTPQPEVALAQKRLADLIRRRAQKSEAA